MQQVVLLDEQSYLVDNVIVQGLKLIRGDGIPCFGISFAGKGLYEEERAAGLAASTVIPVPQVLSRWL